MIPTEMADRESDSTGLPGRALMRPRCVPQATVVGQGHVGAGDRRGAGAAVGLQHVAVQGDRVLTQCGDVDDAAQAAADEPGDLVGAATDLATH